MNICLLRGAIIFGCHAVTTDVLITPDWPAPAHIKAFTTTRHGGVSPEPYATLNLGDHVEDDPALVTENRQSLQRLADLPNAPLWLTQTHSTQVIESQYWHQDCHADGMISQHTNHVCAVLTADCLPVLLCDRVGQQVAAVHAGWRGLLNGIIETAVRAFNTPPENIYAWLGPAIGPTQFEVGQEVVDAFVGVHPEAIAAFTANRPQHHLADIYLLARQRLAHMGVEAVFGGNFCTVSDAQRFYSYRRDHVTGRMASLIWIAQE